MSLSRDLRRSPRKKRKNLAPELTTPGSTQSSWKHELALTDTESNNFLTDDEDEEDDLKENKDVLNTLKLKFERKLKENGELLQNLNTLTGKLTVFRTKLENAEQISRNKLKITKQTYELKLEEKENLIQNLQKMIDEQEIHIKRILDAKGGEDAEVIFNFSNTIHPMVLQISTLQMEKGKLCEEKLNIENELSELKKCLQEEYISLDEYNLLKAEKQFVEKSQLSRKALEQVKDSNWSNSQDRTKLLQEEIRDLQDQLHTKENKHLLEVRNLETENYTIKKKMRTLENKYTTLAYTPPKVHVRTVVDEETESLLETVKAEKRTLQSEMRVKQRNFEEQTEKFKKEKSVLHKKIKMLEEQDAILNTQLNKLRTQVQVLHLTQQQLNDETMKNQKLKDNFVNKEKQFEHREAMIKKQMFGNMNILKTLKNELFHLKKYKDMISEEVCIFKNATTAGMEEIKTQLLFSVSDTNQKTQILVKRYAHEIQLRKKLHNELVELKGNIRVICRVRPIIKEDGSNCKSIISFDHDDDSDLVFVNNKSTLRKFRMDSVFNPSATQSEIFDGVTSVVTSCLDGYNVCIFAYGQTGSGKTYTMEGVPDNPGINQRALQLLFQESADSIDWEFTILVSFMEIYNEMLRDLLSVEPTTKLEIKQNKDGSMNVPGLTHIKVSGVNDVNQIFSLGHQNRMTACTDMNQRSSRSHSILTVTVIGCNVNTNTKVTGKLNLVDLAGSERLSKSGSEGIRMKEAQNINKSLSGLGDVIHALKNKCQHVPYRNTKLTYLLQDSLGGDSKTLMVVQVSPVEKNIAETMCSLNFAQRVRSVELGKASKKVEKS